MALVSYKLISFAGAAALGSLLTLSACAVGPSDADSDELVGASENLGQNDDAVTGTLEVGSTLIATTDVNLRTGPSTSNSILHVVPNGASVTVEPRRRKTASTR